MTVGGVFNEVAQFVLGVVTAVTSVVVFAGTKVAAHGAVAPRAHAVETGIFLAFEAPSLVVGDVEVESVHVVEREHVDILLHKLNGKEMAAHVEVHSAVGKARFVFDNHGREFERSAGRGHADCLDESVHAVEDAGIRTALDGYALAADGEAVGLGCKFLIDFFLDFRLF